MKLKILEHWYDEQVGETYLKVATKYGEFSATAHCHKDDLPRASRFLGGQICETKCYIQALQAKKKTIQIQLNEARTIYNSIYISWLNKKATRTLKARIKFLEKKVQYYDNAIMTLQKAMEHGISTYFKEKEQIRK